MSDIEAMFDEAIAESDDTVEDAVAPDNTDEVPDEGEVALDDEIEVEDSDNSEESVHDQEPEPVDEDFEEIIVDGEAIKVTKQELRDGYLRRQDYSRKTAEAAAVKRQAEWAAAIQAEFDRDPLGTIQALADAYKVPLGVPKSPAQAGADPYEDIDPDVAAVLRKMDEQEARHQAELRRIEQQTEEIARKTMIADVKAEMDMVKADFEAEFGEAINEKQLLEVAMAYNLPLTQAADLIGGQLAKQQKKASTAAAQKAAKAAGVRKSVKDEAHAEAKKVASGVLKGSSGGESGGDISVDDFANIEDLFALMAE
jgi:hypothetical protein